MELYLSSDLCQSARSKEIAGAIYLKIPVQLMKRRKGSKGAKFYTQRRRERKGREGFWGVVQVRLYPNH